MNLFGKSLMGDLRPKSMLEQLNQAWANTTMQAYVASVVSENANLRYQLSMVQQELRATRLALEAMRAKLEQTKPD